MASLYRGGKRAGASKRTLTQRQKDNAGVKSGTLRKGKGGKLNVYNAKTGTWKRAVKTSAVKKRSTAAAKRPSVKKATTATERRRDAAMASRRSSSTSSSSNNRVTAAQESSKKPQVKRGSYTTGTGGGSRYKAAQAAGKRTQAAQAKSRESGSPAAKIRQAVIDRVKGRGSSGIPIGQTMTQNGVKLTWNGKEWKLPGGGSVKPSGKSTGIDFIKITKGRTKEEKYGPGAKGR